MTGRGKFKGRIMDASAIHRALQRIAHQILERNPRVEDLALIGIRTRGVPLALRLASMIKGIEGKPVAVGVLDISLYREDLSQIDDSPVLNKTEIPFDIMGKAVILVDDVLFTGRTTRVALNALMDMGQPQLVQAAVLIDRGHRQLPIHADYVGKNVPTTDNEIVHVMLKETDNEEQVFLAEKD
ncbi:MAG TPA: bifunctional pyr operon transcriptional regulator/uracil phosphoribosyltransferase PyrR [Acidobacteriota bacterium]|nr:bifunctional pyr operon transcriptional regulator/uracil phosphoribosyltransferase PyrR [Acidobacteriota bacterium]